MKQVKVDGEVCNFNEEEHVYSVDGEEVPGTTTVTGIIDKSQPLMWWAVGEARDYIKENFQDHISEDNPYDEAKVAELADAARTAHMKSSNSGMTIGTLVHEYAEDYMHYLLGQKQEPEFPNNPEAQESAIEFLSWVEEKEVNPILMEQMVYHPEVEFAGTFDLKAEIDGDRLITDYKTSSGIYDSHKAQTTAYYFGERRRGDEELDGICIARFPKDDAGFETEIITDDDELKKHWEGFQACREVLDWQQSI